VTAAAETDHGLAAAETDPGTTDTGPAADTSSGTTDSGPAPSTGELLVQLTSPDPHTRDETAYARLVERVGSGDEDGRLADLGERSITLLAHPEIQARTFGALMVAEVVARDGAARELPASTVHRWQDVLCGWYLAEDDLRGWDPDLGWLHAVAHGADALGAFGRSAHTTRDRLAALLVVACDRVLRTGDILLANAEEDRVAFAIALVLTRPELSESDAVCWLDPVRAAFAAGEPGPLPAWVSNTSNTLRSLYVFADRGVKAPEDMETLVPLPHRGQILDALAQALRETFPAIG
jgi:hypothetical protein